MPCTKHLVQVREHMAQIERLGARVAVISFSDPKRLAGHALQFQLPFPLLSDPDHSTYEAYGLVRGTLWQTWHPKALAKYFMAAVRGEHIRPNHKGDDLNQLGGDFVLDGQGLAHLARPSMRSDDRPKVDVLLRALGEVQNPPV